MLWGNFVIDNGQSAWKYVNIKNSRQSNIIALLEQAKSKTTKNNVTWKKHENKARNGKEKLLKGAPAAKLSSAQTLNWKLSQICYEGSSVMLLTTDTIRPTKIAAKFQSIYQSDKKNILQNTKHLHVHVASVSSL